MLLLLQNRTSLLIRIAMFFLSIFSYNNLYSLNAPASNKDEAFTINANHLISEGVDNIESTGDVAGKQVAHTYSDGKISGYLVYLPKDYYDNPSKKYPLVVFFHGSGESGTDINMVKRNGPPKMVEQGREFPFILISPQARYTFDHNSEGIDQFLEQIKPNYRIDNDRFYVTGLSMGGAATWYYANYYPQKVAAAVPICGWGNPSAVCEMKDVPVWAFHNDGDGTVSSAGTKKMISELNKCAKNPAPLMTIYPKSGHDAWTATYNNNSMWDWMLSQSKKGTTQPPANKAPVANAGSDKTLALPTNSATLVGTGSDSDGTITAYEWVKIAGPDATMTDANKATLKLSNLKEGVYTFRLTVTDNKGVKASDDVKVTVTPSSNKAPVANAGGDKSLTLPNNSITLSGAGNDADGHIVAFQWTKTSGPSATLTDENKASLKLSNLVEGNYTFKLTVTDNIGAKSSDEARVLVYGQPGSPVASDNGIFYSYYEGDWDNLPDFSSLTPIKTGIVSNFGLTSKNVPYNYGFVFESNIEVTTAGEYTFYINSDDGSKLFINNKEIVNNGGLHGPLEKSGKLYLGTGKQSIKVAYFQKGGSDKLEVKYSGPSISKQEIPNNKLFKPVIEQPNSTEAISINFNAISNEALPWNNTASNPFVNKKMANLKNNVGKATSISLTFLTSWGGSGSNTSTSSTLFPKNVANTYYWTNSKEKESLKLSGLDKTKQYSFEFYALKDGTDNKTTDYSIGSQTVSLNAANNTSKSAKIYNVSPNGNGEIIIYVKKGASSGFGYLNGLIINTNSSTPGLGAIPEGNTNEKEIVYRINTGGNSYNDNPKNWEQDSRTKRSQYLNDKSYSDSYDHTAWGKRSNPTQAPNYIFESNRYEASWSSTSLGYQLPVTNGKYVVNLYFAEYDFSPVQSKGQRVFNILIENSKVLNNFDIFGEAKNGAVQKSFVVDIRDGILDISFEKIKGQPIINGIEVVREGGNAKSLTLSPIKQLAEDSASIEGENKVNIYPNPVEDNLHIELYSKNEGEAAIKLIDLSGKVIKYFDHKLLEGLNEIEIDVSAFSISKGLFILTIELPDGQTTKHKLLKN